MGVNFFGAGAAGATGCGTTATCGGDGGAVGAVGRTVPGGNVAREILSPLGRQYDANV
jgi:hypothetical protein